MTDEKNQPNDADDVYVIEDTGESLKDFEEAGLEPVEGEGARPAAVASGPDLKRANEENAQLRDQLLRARADFDNFRKRAEREKTDFFRYAMLETIRELLPVLDNFERALSSEAGNVDDFKKGVEMIYKQLSEALAKMGLREVEPSEKFDPTIHEAVMREERQDVPSNTVLETFQKGYYLHDRLMRPALVKVAVGGPEHRSAAAGGESQD